MYKFYLLRQVGAQLLRVSCGTVSRIYTYFSQVVRLFIALSVIFVATTQSIAESAIADLNWRRLDSNPSLARYVVAIKPDLKTQDCIWSMTSGLTIVRIENNDMCKNEKCLTIFILNCDRANCPSTVVFSGKKFVVSDDFRTGLYIRLIEYRGNEPTGLSIIVKHGIVITSGW